MKIHIVARKAVRDEPANPDHRHVVERIRNGFFLPRFRARPTVEAGKIQK